MPNPRPFNNTRAAKEGWGVFRTGGPRTEEIQRIDEDPRFARDEDAVASVRRRADEGSVYHRNAIYLHEPARRAIETYVRKKMSVRAKDELILNLVGILYDTGEPDLDFDKEWSSDEIERVAERLQKVCKPGRR
jgi:hypothetical protein